MKKMVIVLMFLLVSCGSKTVKEDYFGISDYEANYESVFTSLSDNKKFGNAIYQFDEVDEDLKIYTILDGTYELRSDSCSFIKNGSYTDSEIIDIPIIEIFKTEDAEKLCTLTIQLNPTVKDSQVVISPRYSIVYLQKTNRQNKSFSIQIPEFYNAGEILNIKNLPKHRLIQNCVYSEPKVIKESMTTSDFILEFSELKQIDKGSCYYSLVYTSDNIPSRIAFSINIYDSEHLPLSAKYTIKKSKVSVESEDSISLCAVDFKYKFDNKCKGEYKSGTIIQVHTNKRSFYKVLE